MRCGLSLCQLRLSPARQIAQRNPPGSEASSHLKGIRAVRPAAMSENYSDRWETQFWGKPGGLQQGEAFDAGRAAPALSNLLSSGGLAAPGKRVLVPGCGRGYDVIEFVGKGASLAVGLELAPTAQQAASQHLAAQLGKEGEGQRWQVFAGDFFRWEHPSSTSFDVGYDYTFMCALHPDMRQDWAAGWARYLQPGAKLVCLAFPIDPERQTGPPWPVDVATYKQLLLPHGFACVLEEPVPPEMSHPGRGGKECLLVFERR